MTVEKIAEGLSKAQLHALRLTCHNWPMLTGSPKALHELEELGLCQHPKKSSPYAYALDLGLAVKDYLKWQFMMVEEIAKNSSSERLKS